MDNSRYQNHRFLNGQPADKLKPKKKKKPYEATKEEFDKLIAEYDYEEKLRKEKARTQELEKLRERFQKEHREKIASLHDEIRRLIRIIAEKQGAATAAKVLEEVEALHKVRLMDFAAVSQPIKETKVEALHQVRPIELAAVSQDTVKQSEVPAMTSLRPRPVARAVQEPPAASHLKPPRLPRKSSPAAMFAIPKQEEFEENNNVTGFKKPVGDLVDGVTGSHEEVGTVLQYASAATAPTGEAKSLESGTSAKFRRHVRTASVVSRLIQGFEAVAAASNAPATPSRGGSFRIKRGSC